MLYLAIAISVIIFCLIIYLFISVIAATMLSSDISKDEEYHNNDEV